MGTVFALLAILICRQTMSDAAFTDGGWRIPFLISAILLLLSGYIRRKLAESPLYARLKEEGKASTNPIKDTYSSGRNWGLMAIALFGATAPEGVVWYCGQFYTLIYMTTVLKLNYVTVYVHPRADAQDQNLGRGWRRRAATCPGSAIEPVPRSRQAVTSRTGLASVPE